MSMFLGKPPAGIEAWILDSYRKTKIKYTDAAAGVQTAEALIEGALTTQKLMSMLPSQMLLSRIFELKIGTAVTCIDSATPSYANALSSVSIPTSVSAIADESFGNTQLKEVTVPGSVLSVGDSAFDTNTCLVKATYCEGVQSVGNWCHCENYDLREVHLPSTLARIGDGFLSECSNVTSVFYNGSASADVGWNAFADVAEGAKVYIDPSAVGWPADGEMWNNLVVQRLAAS